jgi:hypothetical protein
MQHLLGLDVEVVDSLEMGGQGLLRRNDAVENPEIGRGIAPVRHALGSESAFGNTPLTLTSR